MSFIKFTVIIILTTMFLMACNSTQSDETASATPYPDNTAEDNIATDTGGDYARDNLDLNAVGALLEKSNDAGNFEFLLNSNNRVNNLDLNGDGYVDYISVAEYEDRDSNQRGFTVFDRFGVNDIQEIARLIFDRDRNDNRGARILLNGNEQIYGDNYYYEANWLDKSLNIANWAFGDRATYYQSPYYYDNYPNNYILYRVVETPVYRSRIQEYYPEPIFIRTINPTITLIKIKSSYKDKSISRIFAKLAKPTKEQKEFRKSNPHRPEFVNKGERNDASTVPEKKVDEESRDKDKRSRGMNDKSGDRTKPNKVEKENRKSTKPNNDGKKGGGRKPGKH